MMGSDLCFRQRNSVARLPLWREHREKERGVRIIGLLPGETEAAENHRPQPMGRGGVGLRVGLAGVLSPCF